MSRISCTIAMIAALSSPVAHALDVAGFEKLLELSNRGVKDETGRQAKLSLMYYFQGISDILNGAHDKESGEVLYAGPRKICLPPSVTLRHDILQAMTEQQIRTAERSGAFKADWKSSNLNLFVFLALTSNYPCAQR